MAGNEQVFDSIVDPIANKQVQELAKEMTSLDAVVTDTILAINDLNKLTSNSSTFSQLSKNTATLAIQQEKLNNLQQQGLVLQAKKDAIIQASADKQAAIVAKQTAAEQKAADIRAAAAAKAEAAVKKQADAAIAASKKKADQEAKETAQFLANEDKKNQKIAISSRAYSQLKKQVDDATKNYQDIAVTQGVNSPSAKDALTNLEKYKTRLDDVNKRAGVFANNTDRYTKGIADYFGKAFSGIRTLANIIPNFGIGTFFLLTGELIVAFVKNLGILKDTLDSTAVSQKAFATAVASADYKKGVESVLELTNDIKLAKEGIGNQDEVLVKYNDTLGKTFGFVTNLDEAEQKLVANSDNYIKSLFYKAAAQAVLAQGADELVKAAEKQRRAEELSSQASREKALIDKEVAKGGKDAALDNYLNLSKAAANQKKVADRDAKDAKDQADQATKITSTLYSSLTKLAEGFAQNFSKSYKFQEQQTDQAIEHNKRYLQDIVNRNDEIAENDKQSYNVRYASLKKSLSAQIEIIQLNTTEQLNNTRLSTGEQKDIIDASNYEILKVNQDFEKKNRDLRNKGLEQDFEITKKKLENKKADSKLVVDNPDASTDDRLGALQSYYNASYDLIKKGSDEQQRLAGKNKKSQKSAALESATEFKQLDIDYTAEYNKILEDGYNTQIGNAKKHDTDLLNQLRTASEQRVQAITDASQKELDEIDKQYHKGNLNTRIYEAERQGIINKSQDDILNERIRAAKNEIQLLSMSGLDTSSEQKRLSDLELQQFKTTEQRKTEVLKTEQRLRDELTQAETNLRIEAEQAVLDTIKSIGDANYENQLEQAQKQTELIDKNASDQKSYVDNSLLSAKDKADKDNIIDAKAAKDKEQQANQTAKIRQKEAEFNKEVSLLNVLVSTAEAVGKIELEAAILAANPLTLPLVPLALAQIPIAIASGAIQEAAILATPLPKYAKGTKNYPGGLGVWGEAGTERAQLPTGDVMYSSGTEIANFPKGTIITPHNDLMRVTKPDAIKYTGGQEVPWREVIAAIERNKPANRRPVTKININGDFDRYRKSYFK